MLTLTPQRDKPTAVLPARTPAVTEFTDPATLGIRAGELQQRVDQLVYQARRAPNRGERQECARALYAIGRTAHFQSKGDGTISREAYLASLRVLRTLGDRAQEVSMLADLSETERLLGQPDRAESALRQALGIAHPGSGRDGQRADLLFRLGDLLRVRGRYREAKNTLDQALALQQRLGSEPGQADCLSALGQVALEEGTPALARQLFDQAAALFARHGKVESRAAVLGQLGDVALASGDVKTATRLFREG
ncbi:MAG: hypothetical protein OHK0029_41220 [Armatimonadaceae bacterium]